MKSLRLASTLAAVLLMAQPAGASVIYTYTAPITYWANSWGSANWASYGGLDGSGFKFEFSVAGPLLNLGCGSGPINVNCDANLLPDVLTWHYHGGSGFMNTGSDLGGHLTGLALSTDGNGAVTNARFYLNGAVVIPTLEAYASSLWEAHDGYDQQNLFSSYARQYTTGMHGEPLYASLGEGFSNNRGAGSWSVAQSSGAATNNSVPEPSSLLLVLAAICMLASTRGKDESPKDSAPLEGPVPR